MLRLRQLRTDVTEHISGKIKKGTAAILNLLHLKSIATKVMYKLFAMLEMKYDFKLSKNGEMEETR